MAGVGRDVGEGVVVERLAAEELRGVVAAEAAAAVVQAQAEVDVRVRPEYQPRYVSWN